MLPTILKIIIVILGLLNAGYMTVDGTRALIKGDYIRPATGEYAGQLGPWSKLAEMVGLDPMSTSMKSIFVLFGVVGLFITISFALGKPWAWKAMMIFNICSLWYLFMGTFSSVLQIILLVVLRIFR